MMHNVARPEAAIGFAYCTDMIERLERSYLFDTTGSCEQMKGEDSAALEAYATARLCKIIKDLTYEGKIYNAQGRFTIEAVQDYLKSLANDYQQKHGFEPQRSFAQVMHKDFNVRMDFAFWQAANKMKSWRFLG